MTSPYKSLASTDPVMARLIVRFGKLKLEPPANRSPYNALVRAIIHQQLHGKAARTIFGRFLKLVPGERFPKPASVLSLSSGDFRSAGISRMKELAIRDVAHRVENRLIPGTRSIIGMENDHVVEQLTQIRGVGPWTVHMYLMFTLARPDILPVTDFGIRKGYSLAYGKRKMPEPESLARIGARLWQPWRTYASLYLWRAADEAKG